MERYVELVIRISEEVRKSIINGKNYISYQEYVEESIKNGTPLPKGHGDLIDRDALDQEYDKLGWWEDTDESIISPMQDILFDAPIIIEADKG